MTGRLDGKVALVSAAASGIGRAVARRMAAEGAVLSLFDIDETGLAAVVDELRSGGVDVDGFPGDATDSTTADRWVGAVMERYGRIDILSNNVGVSRTGLIGELADDDWHF
jgi:NAD(P)-dependent dehydrogenase (short-subunit alcohol dehydrogenase family)